MALTTIIKRNGQPVPFDSSKIVTAINKANAEVYPEEQMTDAEIEEVVDGIKKHFSAIGFASIDGVNGVQSFIEKALMKSGHFELAKKYIVYEATRTAYRNASKGVTSSIMSLVRNTNKDVMEENSNKDALVVSTQRDLIAGEVSKDLTMRTLLPEKVARAHKEGAIHFHDADYFLQPLYNCCLVNIGDMLQNGTVMNGKLIEKPKSFQVACTVMTQIIAAVASSQYGGQSLDMKHLAPFIAISRQKYEDMLSDVSEEERGVLVERLLKKEVKAGVQTVQYQINTLMTTNGQTPFVTLFLNIDESYGYVEEQLMLYREILEQRLEGIKNEAGVYVTPPFPKLIYVLDEHNCLKGGKYDWLTLLAVKCTAKRMYPDYISAKKMRENYQGNVFAPMGCRSFLSPWKDADGNYKFEGRFNQGVVSLNLPQIAILSNGDMAKFWEILEQRLALCYEALMCRHRGLRGVTSDVAPLLWQHGAIARLKPGEVIDPLLEGGYSTLSLGYIGIYEMTKIMTGEAHTSEKGKEFALRVMRTLREACDRWKSQTGLGFALYGTPAESLCYRFCRIDRERFGEIKDVTDKGFYTNSYHVDVREEIDAFEKFSFESQFQPISSGGCISYIEIPNMSSNLEALAEMVAFIYDNIQYAEFNTKSDYCMECGYDGEIVVNDEGCWECPVCHNTDHKKMSVVRRTCGYLGSNFWNGEGATVETVDPVTGEVTRTRKADGKTAEIKARYVHLGGICACCK